MQARPQLELPPVFEQAMRDHERPIMRYLLRATGNRDDALDLFQETWLRAYRAWGRVDSADGVRPWVFRIATNLCLNRKRDSTRRARLIADDEFIDGTGGATNQSRPDGVIHLTSAVARLPRKQREAFVMRKFGGLEYEEIATALGCSSEAARAGVYLAMKKIRAEIND
jgi:RNA polymerase sigma-70 factor (ECF subfamily)